jgi:hypothetical protein
MGYRSERMRALHIAGIPGGVACDGASAYMMTGTMKASKGRQGPEAANDVAVCLGVVRLPLVKSDVLITLCTPTYISQKSAAAQDTALRDHSLGEKAPELFKAVFESFTVRDWSLFGES